MSERFYEDITVDAWPIRDRSTGEIFGQHGAMHRLNEMSTLLANSIPKAKIESLIEGIDWVSPSLALVKLKDDLKQLLQE